MKTYRRCIPAVIAILVLLGGCMNLLEPSGGEEPAPGGKGRVEIRIADNARTALPSAAFDKYVLRFAYAGTEGYAHDAAEWSAGLSVDLEPGVWTVYLDAYTGTVVSGTGSADVTVSAGTVTPVTIRIGMNPAAVVKGTLKYKVSYPTAGVDHSYGTEVLTVRDTGGNPVGSSAVITNGAEGSVQLDPGVYFVGVIIEDTVQRTGAARTVAAHIYGGKETSLDITIGEEEFTALVPVTVTAGLTVSGGGVTVTGRAAAAYDDAFCTTLLATADTMALTGQAEITLWVSSAKANVYIRQEVEIAGVILPLNGHLETVTMTGAGTVVNFADTLYTVNLDMGIPAGTITSAVPAAFEGFSVGVTADPAIGKRLRPGSLKYNDGSDHVLTGSGPDYSFVMPGTDVTIYAEIVDYGIRYVTESGAGDNDGSSWANASDDIQKMMDELRAASLDGTTGYTGLYIVKMGAGTYKPKYEPMIPSDEAVPEDYEYNTPGNSSNKAFILREGVQVWGGYPANGGNETDEANRESRFGTYGDVASVYKAILSGDLDNDNAIGFDDAYHVVLGVNIPDDGKTVLDGLTISGGNANGSGMYFMGTTNIVSEFGGGMYNDNSSPKLTRVTISGNKAYNSYDNCFGGGMSNRNGSSPALTNVTISSNQANYSGGMYNSGSSPVLTNVTISGNTVTKDGGGMYNDNSSPTLDNVLIGGISSTDKNTANNGGGMYNKGNSLPVLTNVTISGNTASNEGGGIYNSASTSLTMSGGAISGNEATGNGGGIYNNSSSLTLTNVKIGISGSPNTAVDGGGIYNNNSSLVITGGAAGQISANHATNYGGGVYNSGGSLVLKELTVSSNAADSHGGGIYNDNAAPLVDNVIITGNTAVYGGGMLNNNNSSPVLINTAISNNKADENGGGMLNNNSSSPVLVNVTISGNVANYDSIGTGNGGGMYNDNNSSPVLINLRISGNTADYGGGVYNYGDGTFTEPVLINVTIAGNTATNDGGGICNYSSSPVIRNSIIWGNTASSATGISNQGTSTPGIEYSMVEGESGGTGNKPAPSPVDTAHSPFTSWKDPASYTMPNNEGEYWLKDSATAAAYPGLDSNYPTDVTHSAFSGITFTSTAEAAINAALDYDLRGNDRFNGSDIDMGAYERQ